MKDDASKICLMAKDCTVTSAFPLPPPLLPPPLLLLCQNVGYNGNNDKNNNKEEAMMGGLCASCVCWLVGFCVLVVCVLQNPCCFGRLTCIGHQKAGKPRHIGYRWKGLFKTKQLITFN
jgi:hypothetical protein